MHIFGSPTTIAFPGLIDKLQDRLALSQADIRGNIFIYFVYLCIYACIKVIWVQGKWGAHGHHERTFRTRTQVSPSLTPLSHKYCKQQIYVVNNENTSSCCRRRNDQHTRNQTIRHEHASASAEYRGVVGEVIFLDLGLLFFLFGNRGGHLWRLTCKGAPKSLLFFFFLFLKRTISTLHMP